MFLGRRAWIAVRLSVDPTGLSSRVSISGAATRYDKIASGCCVQQAGLQHVGAWFECDGHARRAARVAVGVPEATGVSLANHDRVAAGLS